MKNVQVALKCFGWIAASVQLLFASQLYAMEKSIEGNNIELQRYFKNMQEKKRLRQEIQNKRIKEKQEARKLMRELQLSEHLKEIKKSREFAEASNDPREDAFKEREELKSQKFAVSNNIFGRLKEELETIEGVQDVQQNRRLKEADSRAQQDVILENIKVKKRGFALTKSINEWWQQFKSKLFSWFFLAES